MHITVHLSLSINTPLLRIQHTSKPHISSKPPSIRPTKPLTFLANYVTNIGILSLPLGIQEGISTNPLNSNALESMIPYKFKTWHSSPLLPPTLSYRENRTNAFLLTVPLTTSLSRPKKKGGGGGFVNVNQCTIIVVENGRDNEMGVL
jgi:hypothetical protein